MLHALSSTFTTCACGSKAKDCALNLMAEFVDGCLPTSTVPLSQRPDPSSTGDKGSHRVNLGPLIGTQRGFRTREKSPLNGGMNGVEMISDHPVRPGNTGGASQPLSKGPHQTQPSPASPSHTNGQSPVVQTAPATVSPSSASDQSKVKGTQEAVNTLTTPELRPPPSHGHDLRDAVSISRYRSPSPSDSDPQPQSEDEEQVPPKMRKRWIHRSTEGLRSVSPAPSPCASNDSLGSVLDEDQMELDASGSHPSTLETFRII
jgi:hypothetical protein